MGSPIDDLKTADIVSIRNLYFFSVFLTTLLKLCVFTLSLAWGIDHYKASWLTVHLHTSIAIQCIYFSLYVSSSNILTLPRVPIAFRFVQIYLISFEWSYLRGPMMTTETSTVSTQTTSRLRDPNICYVKTMGSPKALSTSTIVLVFMQTLRRTRCDPISFQILCFYSARLKNHSVKLWSNMHNVMVSMYVFWFTQCYSSPLP